MRKDFSRLILIDGNAILHRAYHALPPLTTKNGQPVNAVYGFISMLVKVIADLKPTHLAVCLDRPEPTFRKQMYVAYQAQRPKMEEELVGQVDLVKEVLKAMEIPIYELAGYEADDLIGTLAAKARKESSGTSFSGSAAPRFQGGFVSTNTLRSNKSNSGLDLLALRKSPLRPLSDLEVVIVTGDRDFLQLVNDKVKVYMPVKGLSQAKLYGEREVEEKYGIAPSQIVDYKALVGDPSDNYPGVSGIGPKTAVRLLQTFANLEEIYHQLAVRPSSQFVQNKKVTEALQKGEKEAEMAKKLAKIVKNAPVALDLAKARLGRLDKPKVRKLFEKLEFKSLLKRLEGKNPQVKLDKPEKQKKEENEQLKLV